MLIERGCKSLRLYSFYQAVIKSNRSSSDERSRNAQQYRQTDEKLLDRVSHGTHRRTQRFCSTLIALSLNKRGNFRYLRNQRADFFTCLLNLLCIEYCKLK